MLLRLLHTSAEIVQQHADVVAMIHHVDVSLDHFQHLEANVPYALRQRFTLLVDTCTVLAAATTFIDCCNNSIAFRRRFSNAAILSGVSCLA